MVIKRTLPPAATPILADDILKGLKGLVRGQDEIERFSSELKDYFGVKHCYLVSSGKAALTVILKALHAANPEKRDVIIPAYTCYSVPSSVRRVGLGIQLCDIDQCTLDFDYSQLQEMLRGPAAERILAIIPRHIFGLSADIERIRRLTSGLDIAIVEDAAQVMGGEKNGKKLGTLGDAGVFSLGRGKALSTIEGGIILTERDDLANRIKIVVENLPPYGIVARTILLVHAIFLSIFMNPLLFWLPKSLPFLKVGATIYDTGFAIKQFSAFQAGLAVNWQEKLHLLIKIRTENASFWTSRLEGLPSIAMLYPRCRLEGLKDNPENNSKNQLIGPVRYPVVMRDQNEAEKLMKKAESEGAGIMITYPDSVAGIPELQFQFNGLQYPIARDLSKKILTFPTHPFVSNADKERIVEALISMTA